MKASKAKARSAKKKRGAVKAIAPTIPASEHETHAGGRPTKLNAETQKKICHAIMVCATYEAAAEYAGVDYRTFRNWMIEGESATEGAFFQFFQAVKAANANAQITLATNVIDAAKAGDWRAASWILERRFPKAYGQRIGAIDEKELDDTIASELERIASTRQATDVGETARDSIHPDARATKPA